MAATFLLGGVLGAAAMYGAMRAKESTQAARIIYVDRFVDAMPSPSGAAVVPPSATTSNPSGAFPPPSSRSMRTGVASATSNSPAGTLSGLNAERALLDVARGALEREDGAAALATLEQHERKYPSGVLVQEREAIAIHALMILGRTSEALARAGRFRRHFPESALLPTIDSIVEAPPAP
jgi:hypothetical protein